VKWLMLTVFGLGHMRPASGTWGSMPVPVMVVALLWVLGGFGGTGGDGLSTGDLWIINGALVAVGVVFSLVCLRYGADAEKRWGRSDPGQVVADEMAGQSVALLALPWRALADIGTQYTLLVVFAGFLSFRMCDIIKPPPANGLQRLPAGKGILVDDLVAGLYALAITHVCARVLL